MKKKDKPVRDKKKEKEDKKKQKEQEKALKNEKRKSQRLSSSSSSHSSKKSKKKVQVQVLYELSLRGLEKIDNYYEGKTVFLEWKRGRKKENKGSSTNALIKNHKANFNEKVNIKSTLIYYTETEKFETKLIEFVIECAGDDKKKDSKKDLKKSKKDDKKEKKKGKKIGTVAFNLASYAATKLSEGKASAANGDSAPSPWSKPEYLTFPVSDTEVTNAGKDQDGPYLLVDIKSRWLKYDGKLLVLKEEGKSKTDGNSKSSKGISFGGKDYNLKTEEDASEDEGDTTLGGEDSDGQTEDTMSDDDDDYNSESDRSLSSSSTKKPSSIPKMNGNRGGGGDKKLSDLKMENEELKDQLRKANEMATTRMDKISAQKREIESLKKRANGHGGDDDSGNSFGVGGDSALTELIVTLTNEYKKAAESGNIKTDLAGGFRNESSEMGTLVKWFSFALHLYYLMRKVAVNDDKNSERMIRELEDIATEGIDVSQGTFEKLQRAVSGGSGDSHGAEEASLRTVRVLALIVRDLYNRIIIAMCKYIDAHIIPKLLKFDPASHPVFTSDMPPGNIPRRSSFAFGEGTSSYGGNLDGINELNRNLFSPIIQLFTGSQVFVSVISQVLSQIVYFLSARIFNKLVANKNLCTCGFGFQIKLLCSQIRTCFFLEKEKSVNGHLKSLDVGIICDNMEKLKECGDLLVLNKKKFFEGNNWTKEIAEIFGELSLWEIKKLLDNYSADEICVDDVPLNVKMKVEEACKKEGMSPVSLDLDPFAPVNSGGRKESSEGSVKGKERDEEDEKKSSGLVGRFKRKKHKDKRK